MNALYKIEVVFHTTNSGDKSYQYLGSSSIVKYRKDWAFAKPNTKRVCVTDVASGQVTESYTRASSKSPWVAN